MPLPEGSGHGQDEWIASQFPPDFKGYAVELGAYDGLGLSNTLKLERQGWNVLCIEPNPRHQQVLRASRNLVLQCACDEKSESGWTVLIEDQSAVEFTRTAILKPGDSTGTFNTMDWALAMGRPAVDRGFRVPLLTLSQALNLVSFPRLDVLCLDVDGIELRILKGADLQTWKPRIIVVERCFGDDPEPYLIEQGYRFDHYQDVDLFFTRD